MTAKQEYRAKISQFDSNYDFYGCSKNMIYMLVAARKDFVTNLVPQQVILAETERIRYVLMHTGL